MTCHAFPQDPPHSGVPDINRAEWWHCLFNESEDAQMVCTREGEIVEINRKADQLLEQVRTHESRSGYLHQLVTPATAQKLMALLQSDAKHPEKLPGVGLLPGGRLGLVVDLQVTPLQGGYSLLTFKDASRRWRLESHAQRLITAVNSTPDVIFLTNADFRLTFTNAAFQTTTGYTIEEALGQTAEFLRAASESGKIKAYYTAVRQGSDWVGELWNVRHDGTVYPVEATISPIYDQHGNFLGSVAFERDLTAKKKLQDDLLLERNFVRSIINSLDSAVYTVDSDFHLTHFNDGWKKMPAEHGWLTLHQSPRVGGSLLESVRDPAKREELVSVFSSVLNEGRPREFRATGTDGRHWLIHIVPWRHEEEIRGLIYKVTDHTQFTELQNQLYQAQKMETIGGLAAGVAHDFNNLLLAIRGNVSLLLLNEDQQPDVLSRLNQIEQAANRASEITQQLLSFSRPSDEQVTVLDFNQIINEGSHLARRTLRAKINIELVTSPEPIKVRMDGTRAQQLLLNLCVNAHHAMPHGGRLTITNRVVPLTDVQAAKCPQSPQGDFMRCSVADTGTGIPPDVLPRIFDPFFTTKAKGKGTGLGLAIAQSVVSKAGGFMEVESTLGQGTTFHIYLPLVQDEVTRDRPPDKPTLQTGSGRILVVDDLDLVLDFTRNFLENCGYEVFIATSVDMALDILEDEPDIDVLFTDYNMPDKNGWQLIQEVAVRWPDMRLILATGYLDETERIQVERNHNVRILHKPYNISEATGLIAEMMQAG